MKKITKYIIAIALVLSSLSLVGVSSKASSATFIKPVNSNNITSTFGDDYLNGQYRWHTGVDWAAPLGTSVNASAGGTVKEINRDYWSDQTPFSGYGNAVLLQHTVNGKTYETLYAHLNTINVSVGQTVSQGTKVGTVGNTGYSFGYHLHFELHNGVYNGSKTNAVDPLSYVNKELSVSEPEPVIHSFDGSWATLRTVSPQNYSTVNTFGNPGSGLNGTLPTGSLYKVYEKVASNGVDYFKVSSAKWVHRDNSTVTPYVAKASYSTATYVEPKSGAEQHPERGLAPGDSYKTYGAKTVDGQQWYNLGAMGWIKADARGLVVKRLP